METLATAVALFSVGIFAGSFVPTPAVSIDAESQALTQLQQAQPYVNAVSSTQLPITGVPSTVVTEESINARLTGMLLHLKWLLKNDTQTAGVSKELFDKQVQSLLDDDDDDDDDAGDTALPSGFVINDSAEVTSGAWLASVIADAYITDALTLGASSILANDLITPDAVLATAQTDEYCLTYEMTGDTWEWQTCGSGGSGIATTSIDTSAELASIVTDETGNGALVFAGSPTLTGTLTAAAANFSGNIGIGTTTPNQALTVQGNVNLSSPAGAIYFDDTKFLYASSTNHGILFGELAGQNLGTGDLYNIALGYQAGRSADSNYNIFAGTYAGYNSSGQHNYLFGYNAGYNNNGAANFIAGPDAGYNNFGGNNFIIGDDAGYNNTGTENFIFGTNAGYGNSGSSNFILGASAGYSSTGNNNLIIGEEAGYNIGGNGNIILGYKAANNLTSGSHNIVIGYDIDSALATTSNALNIGNLIFGTGLDGTGTTLSSGGIGIGTTTPLDGARLSIAGGGYDSGDHGTLTLTTSDTIGTGLELINTTTGGKNWVVMSTGSGSSSGAGDLQFFNYTDSSVNMVIDALGNVGIASTSPNSKLTIQNTGSGNSFIVEDQAGDTTPFVIDANGGVAIGVSSVWSSSYKMALEHKSTANTVFGAGIFAEVDPSGTGRVGGLDVSGNSKSGNSLAHSYIFGLGGAANHHGTGAVTNAYAVYGYTENYSTGSITNATVFDAGGYSNDVAGGTITNFRMFYGHDLSNAGTITNTYGLYLGDLTAGTQTNQAYSIYASDAGTRNYLAGDLGIGTSSPVSKLSVTDNQDGWSSISIANSNTGANAVTAIDFLPADGNGVSMFVGSDASYARAFSIESGAPDGIDLTAVEPTGILTFKTGGYNERVRVTSSGNIGIGTTTPAQKLQVYGNIRVGTTGFAGCLEDYNGTLIAGTCSSDEGLKKNIEPLESSIPRSYLEAITELTPVTYNWNEEAAGLYSKNMNVANLGLIAQDVEAQFPELVTINEEGYRQVDFRAFPFYIIQALKELWAKVQGHDERIEQLEDENTGLKNRLEEIEDELNIDAPPAFESAPEETPASEEPTVPSEVPQPEPQLTEPEPESQAVPEKEVSEV